MKQMMFEAGFQPESSITLKMPWCHIGT